jgi:hypothetical protein
MRARTTRVAAVVAALGLLAAACGDDGDDEPVLDTSVTETTAASPGTAAPDTTSAPGTTEATAATEAPGTTTVDTTAGTDG